MSNCSSWPDNCGELKPDGDIAGRGVHTAFMASAILTHLAALTHCVCQLRINKSDPKRLLHWLSPKRARNISSALKPFILSLSDQQMVTGLAILVAVVTTTPLQVVTTVVFDDSTEFPAEVHSAFVKCWVRRLFKLLQWCTTVGGFLLGVYKMTSFDSPSGIDGLEIANDFKGVEENWSFGQLMPIVFLALPVLAAAQGFIDEKAKHETLHSQTMENFDVTAAPTPDQHPGWEPELLRPRTTSATFPNNQPRRRHAI
ncbi:hypothetical protein DL95DRAFT_525377 [Leptodontidium sp. 2 PMI_412]|nr:hypothetical protein DL95DRAFT_525377 [Leptodontidium sp. 2 PMI_412]